MGYKSRKLWLSSDIQKQDDWADLTPTATKNYKLSSDGVQIILIAKHLQKRRKNK